MNSWYKQLANVYKCTFVYSCTICQNLMQLAMQKFDGGKLASNLYLIKLSCAHAIIGDHKHPSV